MASSTTQRRKIMGRAIVTEQLEAAGSPAPDSGIERIAKCIPGEVVTFFTGIVGISAALAPSPHKIVVWICFVLGLLGTPFILAKYSDVKLNTKAGMIQTILTTIGFIVWTFSIAGSVVFDWYNPVYAGIAALVFGFLSYTLTGG